MALETSLVQMAASLLALLSASQVADLAQGHSLADLLQAGSSLERLAQLAVLSLAQHQAVYQRVASQSALTELLLTPLALSLAA